MEENTKATATEPEKATEVESPTIQKEFTEATTAPESATETGKEPEGIADDSKKNAIEAAKKTELTGFILSIVGAALSLIGIGAIFGLGCSIPGLVFSILGGKKLRAFGEPAGKATAGLVLGIIGTAVSGITFLSCMLCALAAI